MLNEITILIISAMVIYLLVLWAHSLRRRFGLGHFYAILGGLTAIMCWLTDAGLVLEVGNITFYIGSTVFYTSLLLGVFVIYVFDGPRNMRIAISTVAGVSILMPLIATTLHYQANFIGSYASAIAMIPEPSLRINSASVFTTIVDLFFLAIAWEFLGKPRLKIPLWLRTFATLLGVMVLDVLLFSTLAFGGTAAHMSIMQGTLISRVIICAFAFPFLYAYVRMQSKKEGGKIENRPVLAILQEVKEVKNELAIARKEIDLRKAAEAERDKVIEDLQKAISEIKTLRGMIPICASCKNVRDDQGYWKQIEKYISEHTEAKFTHGICPECRDKLYPELKGLSGGKS